MKSLILFFFVFSLTNAHAGNEGGHGGDPYAFEVRMLAKIIANKLTDFEKQSPHIFSKWKFSAKNFKDELALVTVHSDEGSDMLLRGEEVDGINFPKEKRIKMNRTRWREANLKSRLLMVLHEYFGIIGVERDNYEASNDFIVMINELAFEASQNLLVIPQYFYGRCIYSASLQTIELCTPDSVELENAIECARRKSLSKCQSSSREKCEEEQLLVEVKFSKKALGARYCEVQSIVK